MNFKNIRKRVWLLAVFFILVMILGKPSPLYYEVEPVSAQVVDAETGKPIPKAVIMLWWGMIKSTYHSKSSSAHYLGGQDTLTDHKGNFTVPGWKRWWREWFSFSNRRIDAASPAFRILKSGYVPMTVYVPSLLIEKKSFNTKVAENLWLKQIVKGLNGEKIALEKLPLRAQARYDAFHNVFLFRPSHQSCQIKSFLNSGYLTEIYKEQKIALQAGLNLRLSDEERQIIINFKEPNLVNCLLIANGRIQQRF